MTDWTEAETVALNDWYRIVEQADPPLDATTFAMSAIAHLGIDLAARFAQLLASEAERQRDA